LNLRFDDLSDWQLVEWLVFDDLEIFFAFGLLSESLTVRGSIVNLSQHFLCINNIHLLDINKLLVITIRALDVFESLLTFEIDYSFDGTESLLLFLAALLHPFNELGNLVFLDNVN